MAHADLALMGTGAHTDPTDLTDLWVGNLTEALRWFAPKAHTDSTDSTKIIREIRGIRGLILWGEGYEKKAAGAFVLPQLWFYLPPKGAV